MRRQVQRHPNWGFATRKVREWRCWKVRTSIRDSGRRPPLANLLGTRASAFLESSTRMQIFWCKAADNGVEFNDIVVRFVEVSAAGDQAFAAYDSITKELVIDIQRWHDDRKYGCLGDQRNGNLHRQLRQ